MAQVTTRAELARFGALLLDAIGELEEITDLLEAALGVEHTTQPAERPFQRLRTLVGFRTGQLARAASMVPAATEALDALPTDVDLASVGPVLVVSARTVAVAPTWPDRLRPTPNRRALVERVEEVRSEMGAALGDLERARVRARLAAMRLDG